MEKTTNKIPTFELGEYSKLLPSQKSLSLEETESSEINPQLMHLELSENDERLLTGKLKGVLKVIPYRDGLAIFSSSHIGVVNFDSFSVVVKPKILMSTENLFGMISKVYGLEWIQLPDFTPETDENYLIDIIIWSLVTECKNLMKKGLYKSYVTYQDNTKFLKGKLLLKQHLLNVLENRPSFACEYDELEYNNLENQIILFCLKRSYQITKIESLKKEVRKLIFQFSSAVSDIHITSDQFKHIHYNRQNIHYENAHDLCKLIIDSSGIVDYYSDRKHRVSSFFFDMNLIFERFVAKLFEWYYPLPSEAQKGRKAWTTDIGGSSNIRTDILIYDKNGKVKSIIDTKYKKDISEADRFQIGFYIHEYEKNEGFAILPRRPESRDHNLISKEQEIAINVRHIDIDEAIKLLYSEVPEDKDKLKNLVEELVPMDSDFNN